MLLQVPMLEIFHGQENSVDILVPAIEFDKQLLELQRFGQALEEWALEGGCTPYRR